LVEFPAEGIEGLVMLDFSSADLREKLGFLLLKLL
jgi:hypothetical protein